MTPQSTRSRKGKKSALAKLQSLQDELREVNDDSLINAKKVMPLVEKIAISVNIIVLWLQLQYEGHKAGVPHDFADPGVWPALDTAFDYIEHVFNILFLLELTFRLFVLRRKFFYQAGSVDKFNIFDLIVVLATSFDLYIVKALAQQLEDELYDVPPAPYHTCDPNVASP
eukprot:CAMPEP_0115747444 /NCGR_PEP_ID=MMETSP0272-20121206/93158_1 /TAXON_ID=71861 /ORGANISM="Scrippsiella trochoidea, Strain CCMP3099" /LENGTH=169 /DNA_ID=CAMNT_0003192421 /DNA_START=45 /DNA_END=553 /DNA_ORIENTATION=-